MHIRKSTLTLTIMPIIRDLWLNAIIFFSILELYIFWNPNSLIPMEWADIVCFSMTITKITRLVQVAWEFVENAQPRH